MEVCITKKRISDFSGKVYKFNSHLNNLSQVNIYLYTTEQYL